MRRWFGIGIVLVVGWLQLGGCSGGVLSGGTAGAAGASGRAGAGGGMVPTGRGGTAIPTGSGDPFPGCGQPMLAPPVLANILIALDTSAAMNDVACSGCDTPSRWANAVDAINATVPATQGKARWGLKLFGDGLQACGSSDRVEVPTGSTPESFAMVLGARTTGGGVANPTGRATRNAVITATRYLTGLTTYNPSYIVLVAAGAPNCAPGAADPAGDDSAPTVSAIVDARTAGFGTFVVGLGSFDAATEQNMQAMASAGNPGLTGPLPNYFTAVASADLQAALRTIAHATRRCMFEIPPPPSELLSREHISVRLGDIPIAQDANNGWTYADGARTSLQFHGTACEEASGDPAPPAFVTFNCLAI